MVECSNRGRGREAENGEHDSDGDIDPEQRRYLIVSYVNPLHGRCREAARDEYVEDAGNHRHHSDEAEVGRIEEAGENNQ